MTPMALRVAARALAAGYFNLGDPILYGKWKNHHGIIKEFGQDGHGNPTITIEPVPKGRKHDKVMGLFRVWHDPPPDQQPTEPVIAAGEEDEDDE